MKLPVRVVKTKLRCFCLPCYIIIEQEQNAMDSHFLIYHVYENVIVNMCASCANNQNREA